MKICADCFANDEIKRFVRNSSNENGLCDCCHNESALIDLSLLTDHFVEFLNLFSYDINGFDLIEAVQRDWHPFESEECARTILGEIINNNEFPFSVSDKVSYVSDMADCFNLWSDLKHEVQESKRFFYDIMSFDWVNYVVPNERIKEGSILYRSRIVPAGKKNLSTNEMGCPPKEKATAGRANPVGIPYLYLCDRKETTYYEIRALYLDKVSVGEFVARRDLKIVDFSKAINLFYTDSNQSLMDVAKRKILFAEISADLSKPLRRFDTEIEYVPTQFICEYCKIISDADGIRFNSSLDKNGANIVLFNDSDVVCRRVENKEIKDVKIASN